MSRDNAWYGRWRKLRVLLDDTEIGRVGSGKTESFDVAPGRHTLHVQMDWVKSEPATFTCGRGETFDVQCNSPRADSSLRDILLTSISERASRPFTVTVTRRRKSGTDAETTVLVDAHVHYYHCFGWDAFLDGTAGNFEAAARRLDPQARAIGVLLLAETSADHWFQYLRKYVGRAVSPGWKVAETAEDGSVIVRRDDGRELVAIAGRQIQSRERIELLALAWSGDHADGRPIREVLGDIAETAAIPVLPWGFGKWWLRRGAVVREILESDRAGSVFVGDNGGRPWLFPRPRLFRTAEAMGIPILPGTDPLPLARQAGKAGRYGFVLSGDFDANRPAESIRRYLAAPDVAVSPYGRRETLTGFARAQIALRHRGRS